MMGRTESLRLAVAAFVFVSIAEPAMAADSSRWDGDARSAIRLVAGTLAPGAATVRAGVELRLKPGWHTYWRHPGDAGIPPRFDFNGSQNVKSVEIRWPDLSAALPGFQKVAEGHLGELDLHEHLVVQLVPEPDMAARDPNLPESQSLVEAATLLVQAMVP